MAFASSAEAGPVFFTDNPCSGFVHAIKNRKNMRFTLPEIVVGSALLHGLSAHADSKKQLDKLQALQSEIVGLKKEVSKLKSPETLAAELKL